MANKDRASEGKRGSAQNVTRMRSPFTADVPDEYGEAKWIPEIQSLPDASNDPDVVDRKALDPMGFLPGSRSRKE